MAKKKNNDGLILFGLGIAAVVAMGAAGKKDAVVGPGDNDNLPRGVRNNNPGNIRMNAANDWEGKIPINQNTDGEYEQFTEYVYGVRAMIILLQTYKDKYDLITIRDIISRWAPPPKNPTVEYINFISDFTGYGPDIGYNFDIDNLYYLVAGIGKFENLGMDVISIEEYNQAVSLL